VRRACSRQRVSDSSHRQVTHEESTMVDLSFASATDLVRMIKSREISSLELLEHYFARIDRLNGPINAVIAQDREAARQCAQAADAALARGEDCGPLHGLPMTVKESYDVAGFRTTWGIPAMKDNVATRDALSIQRLKRAGAVIFGKTNVPLRLADFQSYNDIYGTTNNPWDTSRTPGGSSGGSAAALAAGLTGIETGSDIGGSIRNPAHFCGVFGHKPTWNLLPPRGHAMPGVLSPSDISVIGPLARSARDLETALLLMAGPDEIAARGLTLSLPRLGKPVSALRVALWPDDQVCPVSRAVRERVEAVGAALANAGATVDDAARPDFSADASSAAFQFLLQATMTARVPDEDYAVLKRQVAELAADDDSFRANTLRAQAASFRDWNRHNEIRTHLRWAWHAFFERFDVLLTPIMPTSAFPHDHSPFGQRTVAVDGTARPYFEQVFWAGLAGVSLLPATIVPTGPDTAGLPIGVQIIGPEYGDLTTIAVAQLLEQAGFAFQAPPGY
jgi:amidase